ncbi:LADA_0G14510g1_1 [Lachancea dasiensis]|uniref:LADA_0G14510g1_1 n=1 Tax=Lachancea dasiensis TaxID=1072105 RepID=A0A1G4JWF2_9SACH|nr:LADA_0G14510g1_1 [Lachancea dasiensis]
MTSPTSRKTVRLASLLSGNKIVKTEGTGNFDKPDVSADDFLDGIEDYSTIPAADDDSYVSDTNLNDCEVVHDPKTPKISLKDVLTGKVNKASKPVKNSGNDAVIEDLEVLHVNDDQEKNREAHERIMSALGSAKKTNVRNLFGNFKKRPRGADSNEPKQDILVNEPLKRMHDISTLQEVVLPFPLQQHVTGPLEEIPRRPLSLPRKTTNVGSGEDVLDSKEYSSLINLVENPQDSFHERPVINRTFNDSLWTQEFAPDKLADVILEERLKSGVDSWLRDAFERLRKKTTREKLLKKKTDADDLGWFVVEDDVDETDNQQEEFVPLMILFGNAVGKNTLVKTIVNEMSGQVFEVNSSSNRSKKDIIDNVLEFSTTHYVKEKGSRGIILFSDVDVLFRERDKLFWATLERLLLASRRPVVLICRDINFVPLNLIQVAEEEKSLFHANQIDRQNAVMQIERLLNSKEIKFAPDYAESLLHHHNNDIRKCFMALQWHAVTGTIRADDQVTEAYAASHETDLASALINSCLRSDADLIESSLKWRSNFHDEKDHTLNCAIHSKEFTSLSDEERLAFDYMVDYKYHLHDCLRHPLLPFELNVGGYLSDLVLSPYAKEQNSKKIIEKATQEVASYLSSRVPDSILLSSQQYASTRMTRNSRKVKEILDRFSDDGAQNLSPYDEVFMFLTSVSTRRQMSQEIIPFLCEVAKNDRDVKEKNKRIFETAMHGAQPGSGKEVVKVLLQNHAFHPIWFNGEPDPLLEAWQIKIDAGTNE